MFLFLIFAGLVSFIYLEIKRPVSLPSQAYLELKLRGQVMDLSWRDLLTSLFTNVQPVSLHDLWVNLRKARHDERIKCLLVRLGPLICDWGKINELREMIKEFRTSGKKVYFYLDEIPEADREYYLASVGDKVILHPLGWLGINGIGGFVPFFKNTLKKLGIQVEVEQVEEYKTAYNSFTEEKFTPAHREMITSLTEDIFHEYIQNVAQRRHLDRGQFLSLINHGLFQGKEAQKAGLVDEVLFPDEIDQLLKEEGHELKRVTLDQYSRASVRPAGPYRGKKIAILYAQGPIITGESLPSIIGGETVARWLRRVREDSRVKAVILRVDSPGGSAVGSDYIWREVVLTRKEKPVVVSMSDLAGSGGYWISMAANKIVAHPQSLTGSIGVLAAKFDLSSLYEKLGIADLYSTFRPLTEEEKAKIKEEIRWTYDQFLLRAAEGRGKTKEEIDRLGHGRVWTGKQAKEIGLVDELGGLSKAIEMAKQLAGIPQEEEVRIDVWPKKISLLSLLLGKTEDSPLSSLRQKMSHWQAALPILARENVWAIMPFWEVPR